MLGIRVRRRIYREGLVRALESRGMTVAGASDSFTELLQLTQLRRVDCVVVEVAPGESGARDAIAALRQAHPQLRIVVLHELDRFELHRLKKAGANATADRDEGLDALLVAVTGAPRIDGVGRTAPL